MGVINITKGEALSPFSPDSDTSPRSFILTGEDRLVPVAWLSHPCQGCRVQSVAQTPGTKAGRAMGGHPLWVILLLDWGNNVVVLSPMTIA